MIQSEKSLRSWISSGLFCCNLTGGSERSVSHVNTSSLYYETVEESAIDALRVFIRRTYPEVTCLDSSVGKVVMFFDFDRLNTSQSNSPAQMYRKLRVSSQFIVNSVGHSRGNCD